mmetsp:Transcript_12065/g.16398  ORF Transcript_12065/g.16398 Transcript_12065/m.16398 type:complete len:227 (+) Transcript_12065:1505-2185(+)
MKHCSGSLRLAQRIVALGGELGGEGGKGVSGGGLAMGGWPGTPGGAGHAAATDPTLSVGRAVSSGRLCTGILCAASEARGSARLIGSGSELASGTSITSSAASSTSLEGSTPSLLLARVLPYASKAIAASARPARYIHDKLREVAVFERGFMVLSSSASSMSSSSSASFSLFRAKRCSVCRLTRSFSNRIASDLLDILKYTRQQAIFFLFPSKPAERIKTKYNRPR